MYVDDLASACEFFLKKKVKNTLINIGSGHEDTIKNYAKFIMKKMEVNLKIEFEQEKPNGTPRKILNSGIAKNYGWNANINLSEGFDLTFQDYLKKLKYQK